MLIVRPLRSRESIRVVFIRVRGAINATVIHFAVLTLSVACVLLVISSAWAQDLSRSSLVPSDSRDTAVGANVGAEVQAFAEGVPQLQRTDRAALRDTGSRGTFVGADAEGIGIFGEGTGTTSATGRRTTGRTTGRGSTRQTRTQPRTGQTGGPAIRPVLALGFRYVPRPSLNVGEKVAASLKRVPQLSGNSSVRVRVEGSTVVLEGTVPTFHDRVLSEQIVALSPGVTVIENRLAVEGVGTHIEAEREPQRGVVPGP